MKGIGPAVVADGGEVVVLQKVIDGDLAFVFDMGGAADEAFLVEEDVDDSLFFGHGGAVVLLFFPGLPGPVEPDRHRKRVCVQAFGAGKNNGRRANIGQRRPVAANDRRALDEVEDA